VVAKKLVETSREIKLRTNKCGPNGENRITSGRGQSQTTFLFKGSQRSIKNAQTIKFTVKNLKHKAVARYRHTSQTERKAEVTYMMPKPKWFVNLNKAAKPK